MMTEEMLRQVLEEEKEDLLFQVHRTFWQDYYHYVLTQNESPLETNKKRARVSKMKREEIISGFSEFISKICEQYKTSFRIKNYSGRIDFRIGVCFYKKDLKTELSVYVYKQDIIFRVLPYEPILLTIPVNNYLYVEKIISSFCELLFNVKTGGIEKISKEYEAINSYTNNLTIKTIEIAKQSIRAFYRKYEAAEKKIIQRNLYSSLLVNGKMVRVFHSDFLENPSALIQKLKLSDSNENITK